ncbi:MAG: ATP-binding protein [Vigna little leaf phytoplasma]|nr:ATP-binding protein [Vigna little leaf phytoplasma]
MCSFDITNFEFMKNYIKQQKETKDLQIEDKDVLVIYRYLQLKSQTNYSSSYQLFLKTKPYMHIVLRETPIIQQKNFEDNLEKTNCLFNQDFQLTDLNLGQIKAQNDIQIKILNDIKKMIKNLTKVTKGLFLYGPIGIGKTFFLKILIKKLIQEKIPFLFLFMPDLTRQFRTNWYNEMMENKLNYLKKIPYLFLDDLGAENMSPLFRDDIFLPLLYYRLEKKIPTFFTSNLNFNDLCQHLASSKDFNSDVKSIKIIKIIKNLTYSYDCNFH